MTRHEEEENVISHRFTWEGSHFMYQGQRWLPKVSENLEPEANTCMIRLDGRSQNDLSWNEERQKAAQCVEKGKKIFWIMDLGLFDSLSFSLTNQTQFLSLTLALEHFRRDIWPIFHEHTFGLALYEGPLDYSQQIPPALDLRDQFEEWLHVAKKNNPEEHLDFLFNSSSMDQSINGHLTGNALLVYQLFCRDIATDFFHLLLGYLPDALLTFLLIDASQLKDKLFLQALLLHPDCYENLQIALKGSSFLHEGLGWRDAHASAGMIQAENENNLNPSFKAPKIGFCLPPKEKMDFQLFEQLHQALQTLVEKKQDFRILSEGHLTTQWEGLDYIVTSCASLTPQGIRKFKGFCAAGGTVLNVDAFSSPGSAALGESVHTFASQYTR